MNAGSRFALAVLGCVLPFARPANGQYPPWVMSASNSASYSRSIAQGSIFVVFGYGLNSGPLIQAKSLPVPTVLAETSVRVSAGTTQVECPLFYVSGEQLAAMLPSGTPAGTAQLTVTYAGLTSYPVDIEVVPSAFGLYTTTATGVGPGSITSLQYELKTFSKPAKRGETLTLWGTGLGPITGDEASGPRPYAVFDGVEVFIGNRPAKVVYAGRSGCCVALDQVMAEVPQDTPEGCFVPVAVRRAGVTSNFASVAVASSDGFCAEHSGVPAEMLRRALSGERLKLGFVAVGPVGILQSVGFSFAQPMAARVSAALGVKVSEADVRRLVKAYRSRNRRALQQLVSKYNLPAISKNTRLRSELKALTRMDQVGVAGIFGGFEQLGFVTPQVGAYFPSTGTCTVLTHAPAGGSARSFSVDAGSSMTLQWPGGTSAVARNPNGAFQALLGAGTASAGLPLGMYTVSGSGGAQVGSFHASLSVTGALTWLNKSAISAVDRTSPITFTWSGGPANGHVLIGGAAESDARSAAFACVEEASAGAFTVPAQVLSALPPAAVNHGYLFVARHPLENAISIPGLDYAYFADASVDYRTVTVR